MGIVVKKPAPAGDVAKAISKTSVDGTVVKKHPDGSEEEKKEAVPVKATTVEHPVIVGVTVGVTRNLGNYESLKASVSISIPCALDAEEIEATYEQAKNWVDSKVNEINQEVSDSLE